MKNSLRIFAIYVAVLLAPSIAVAFDSDYDGAQDYVELYTTGTNPLLVDSDGGGVIDSVEILLGSAPLNAVDDVGFLIGDADVDGIDDINELPANPFATVSAVLLDSDFDLLPDGAEWFAAAATDPGNWDSDRDGISDSSEPLLGCNPNDPRDVTLGSCHVFADLDGDGLDDLDQALLGLIGPDADGDGMSNAIELINGTDPRVFTAGVCVDGDGDGICVTVDCDDFNIAINQLAAEVPGNGIDENCDGLDAQFGLQGLLIGELIVNEIMKDPSVVADNAGEWFEIYNPTPHSIDLIGLIVADAGTNNFVVAASVPIAPGGFVVFANNSDLASNGGVVVHYQFPGAFVLANGADEVLLMTGIGLIDGVNYDDATFPDTGGAALALEPGSDALANDDGANWCAERRIYGDGDRGTPGIVNPSCSECPADPDNDIDLDTICGDVDNCPDDPNTGQEDLDLDGIGDVCDLCSNDPDNDLDADTVCGDVDNCPGDANLDQANADGDSSGDVCDVCPNDATDDVDNDTICGLSDNCPNDVNPTQINTDADAFGDACDPCVNDPDNDIDNDTVCGDVDNCPAISNGTQSNIDGDAFGDLCDLCPADANNDLDMDTFCGDVDNCPVISNIDQMNVDNDGFGDVCDLCVNDPLNDIDADTVCGDVDNCPVTSNVAQTDDDNDGLGNACDLCSNDPDNDQDGDTVCGEIDNCPSIANVDQADGDRDSIGNLCDACPADPNNDVDGDAICGDVDNCPDDANSDQLDSDGDGPGDACERCPFDPDNDVDRDSICGDVDNCVDTPNPAQANQDGDSLGDQCDECPELAADSPNGCPPVMADMGTDTGADIGADADSADASNDLGFDVGEDAGEIPAKPVMSDGDCCRTIPNRREPIGLLAILVGLMVLARRRVT